MASNTTPSSSLQLTLDFGEKNHRKRRRNRTRVSCLNCYAAKRKCDRKRPCTRSLPRKQTGLCVYEVDDPTARNKGNMDENSSLRRRIAELESLIREMNNRPHPRWLAPGGVSHNPALKPPQHKSTRCGPSRPTKSSKANPRSSSIDAFFSAIADTEEQDFKVKVETDTFVPEFTPSESGSPSRTPPSLGRSGSPLTPLSSASPLSISAPYTISAVSTPSPASPTCAPFTFRDEEYADTSEGHPLSSFLQGAHDDMGIPACSPYPPAQRESPDPSEASEEGPPLASIFQPRDTGVSRSPSCYLSTRSQSPELSGTPPIYASVGMQTCRSSSSSRLSSLSPPEFSSKGNRDLVSGMKHGSPGYSEEQTESNCRCLLNAAAYHPLVFFASALRTSREALEDLHPPPSQGSSSCVLFRRILELDEHIFSASPATPQSPTSDLDIDSSTRTSTEPTHLVHEREPILMPSSPPAILPALPIRHAHSYSLPFYSTPESSQFMHSDSGDMQLMHDQQLYPDSSGYFAEAAGFPPLQLSGWR